MNASEHAAAHYEEYLAQLKGLLAIPSVSTLPEHRPDMRRAANWLADHLRAIGLTHAEVLPTGGHPLVYAEWLGSPEAATVLIYGHYDVQPPDPLDEWTSPPFEPTVRDGKLYARGATDDKGQLFAQVKAVDALLSAEGALPVNVKFLLEGEEEIGSPNLEAFIKRKADMLAADVVLISDSHILAPDQPSIVYGLRGLTYMEIEVRGPRSDLHSGGYGGTVHNPAQALCEIIAALHRPDGAVAVPGFYDRVRPFTEEERAELARLPYSEEKWKSLTGAPKPWGEANYTLIERIGARPTLEVNGLVSGFTGEGSKTIIPARALAKVSCRLVPDQDPDEIYHLVRDHVLALAPETVAVEVRLLTGGRPALIKRDVPAMTAAAAAYKAGFGAEPVFARAGGSIPVVAVFQQVLGTPVILMGFGLPDDGVHAPNEKFTLENLRKGIQTAIHFHKELRRGES
jgi:acetylornithine deacetylase/succinyl-diaminopimelate desuccinylase-like protein